MQSHPSSVASFRHPEVLRVFTFRSFVILFDVDEPPGRSVTNTHVYRVVLHQDEKGHNGSDHFKTSTGLNCRCCRSRWADSSPVRSLLGPVLCLGQSSVWASPEGISVDRSCSRKTWRCLPCGFAEIWQNPQVWVFLVPGVWQSSGDKVKLRPIDDFAENRINGAYGYSDKLDLRTLDQVIWLCCAFARAIHDGVVRLRLSDGTFLEGTLHSSYGADGALPRLSVLDLSNAYKQLPLHPTNRKYSLITLKDPKSGKAACFEGRVLPFGATASVVHFNRCSRLIQRIGIELNLLMTNYFDDYPVLAPCALCDSSMSTMTMLLQLLGFDYAEHKLKPFDVCASVLGVEVDVSTLPDGDVAVKNKLSRVQEVSNLIDSTIAARELSFKDASKLLGRVQYADSFVMGRDGRLAMHDIREHIKGGDKRGSLSVESCTSLGLLKTRLLQGAPRTIPWKVDSNPALIFTDGASEADAHTIGGVLLIDGCVEYFAANVPPELVSKWLKSSKHIIGMVELYAVAVARKTWEHRLASRKTISFVDNDAAKESLVRGTSGSRHFREILLAIERVESDNRSWVWTARVPSHSNPADEPSRGVFNGILKKLCAERVNAFCPMMQRSLPHLWRYTTMRTPCARRTGQEQIVLIISW